MTLEEIQAREAAHFLPVVKRMPVALVEGRGSRVVDVAGRVERDVGPPPGRRWGLARGGTRLPGVPYARRGFRRVPTPGAHPGGGSPHGASDEVCPPPGPGASAIGCVPFVEGQ